MTVLLSRSDQSITFVGSSNQYSLKNDAFDKLISCVKQLNSKIEEDVSLGEGFCIGLSYFCGLTSDTVNVLTPLSRIAAHNSAVL